MSTEETLVDRRKEDGDVAIEAVKQDEPETPKAEPPVSIKVLSPSTTVDSTSDYFSARSTVTSPSNVAPLSPEIFSHLPPLSRATSRTTAPSVAATASDVTVSGHIEAPGEGAASMLQSPSFERPPPHSSISALSVETTDSNATITAATAGRASSSLNSETPRPSFPNQSYAALHHQTYPSPHVPPTLRQRSSHPGQIFTFASALATSHPTGSRTVGHSPAVTPGVGLYSPRTESITEYETPGTYASPFLHFTHRQAPKETHVADVDVDPISGRKLINHYEIMDELGRGTHGKVKLGRDLETENTYVAIKIVERFSKRRKLGKLGTSEDKVKKEVAILKKARHPNIVALLEVIDDPTRKKVYIVLEWVERGEIEWREKAPREIAMVEARRYQRERSGKRDAQTDAEDSAVLKEAHKRLRRRKRDEQILQRRMLKERADNPDIWSHEFAGDDLSEDSEEDRLSRISTNTESVSGRLLFNENRRGSRAPSPWTIPEVTTPTLDIRPEFLPVAAEAESMSPQALTQEERERAGPTGLEGTMYGAYESNSANSSRIPSLVNNAGHHDQHQPKSDRTTSSGLADVAAEILDGDLNPELEYVPVMTIQSARVAFRDTLLGLQYLHYQNIVHRDIKPPNLLSTKDRRVKISDFGVSYLGRPMHEGEVEVSEQEATDLDDETKELAKTVGTPAFYAPELCMTEHVDEPLPVTKAIDVWALGITLFCMLFARTPFVDNEFVVMRQIADEDIYIPRRRLCPVNSGPRSRPSSHNRLGPHAASGRRYEYDLIYEDVDDDLYDLLKRLLTKDPRKRITLEEVRHHPWVVADLSNKLKWLEETDPSRQSDGKKIEVSKEDVNTAVVPLQFLDRVRSGVKKIGERLGFSSKPSGRARTQSNAGLPGTASPVPSAGSSSSSISQALNQELRRHSLRGDESIFTALKASREGDHPLSKSLAASPEVERGQWHHFDEDISSARGDGKGLQSTPSRPSPPERSKTVMSTSESGRTVKQADIKRGRLDGTPPPSPGLPGTPVALDSPGGSGLQSILGSGAARRALKSFRERSMPRSSDLRGVSLERDAGESLQAHGEPSLAVSQTMAAGHVHLPDALQDMMSNRSVPSSARQSPIVSRQHSAVNSPRGALTPATAMSPAISRNNSGGSLASYNRAAAAQLPELSKSLSRTHKMTAPESSAEDWQRADDERIRRLIQEGRDGREVSARSSPAPFDDRTCPPSPDDSTMQRRGSRRPSAFDLTTSTPSSHATSPTTHGGHPAPGFVSSSSDLGSAVSMSISNPSIPSAISEASSTDLANGPPLEGMEYKGTASSNEPFDPWSQNNYDEPHYDQDHSFDSDESGDAGQDDEYDSSSDSDGGLVMSRRRSKVSASGNTPASHDPRKERRGTDVSKTSRSGSNTTMKKIRSRGSQDEARRSQGSLEE